MDFTEYLSELRTVRAQAESTAELSLREALLRVVRALGGDAGRSGLLIAQEANAEMGGQPDVFRRLLRP